MLWMIGAILALFAMWKLGKVMDRNQHHPGDRSERGIRGPFKGHGASRLKPRR